MLSLMRSGVMTGQKGSELSLVSCGNTGLLIQNSSQHPSVLGEKGLSSRYREGTSHRRYMICFRGRSESPSCTYCFSNSFSLKYLLCQDPDPSQLRVGDCELIPHSNNLSLSSGRQPASPSCFSGGRQMWHSPHRRDLQWALLVVPRSLFPGLKVMGSRFPLLFFR